MTIRGVTARELRMEAALKLVLLFHSPNPWTADKGLEWRRLQTAAGVKDAHSEATSKALCDVVREVLGVEEGRVTT